MGPSKAHNGRPTFCPGPHQVLGVSFHTPTRGPPPRVLVSCLAVSAALGDTLPTGAEDLVSLTREMDLKALWMHSALPTPRGTPQASCA